MNAQPRPEEARGPEPVTAPVDAGLGTLLPAAASAPEWIQPLLHRVSTGPLPLWVPAMLARRGRQDRPGHRESAVLILLGEQDATQGPDLLLTQRAATLRTHAGQPAFPGGALDPGESPTMAALREGHEETGLVPDTVRPLLLLPTLSLPVSNYAVTPVVAHWETPGPVGPVDIAETAAVARVPIADLADPDNRLNFRHPSGFVGPAFDVAGMRVWGFTAALVDMLLELGGWAQPWDRDRVVEMSAGADRTRTGSEYDVAEPGSVRR
ncbi:CoA pyrophosphatase [Nakamurella silvestris]|nr:CoA pyrophosphatase [Nakamurella silvestris]